MIKDETKNPRCLPRVFRETVSFLFCDAGEARTHDQWLKRPLLYQLSYRVNKFTAILEKIIILNYNKLKSYVYNIFFLKNIPRFYLKIKVLPHKYTLDLFFLMRKKIILLN